MEWYRNGQLLEADKTVIQKRNNRHSLLLQQVGRVDSYGKYQCRAKNSLGEAMALTEVSGKPTPASFKSPSVGEEKERYMLEWVVTSTSPVEGFLVEWRLPGQEGWTSLEAGVHKVGEESYAGQQQITGLQPDTEYEARVGATNVYGPTNSRVFQVCRWFCHLLTHHVLSVLHTGGSQDVPAIHKLLIFIQHHLKHSNGCSPLHTTLPQSLEKCHQKCQYSYSSLQQQFHTERNLNGTKGASSDRKIVKLTVPGLKMCYFSQNLR